eukprot:g11672.t1
MYNCSSTADGGLEDGKRVAIVGGLGDGSSHDGVWTFHADTGRWTHCSGGPAPAGHVAALDADGQRLLLSFGVRRSPDSLNGDSFLETMNVFDLRMNRWDDLWKERARIGRYFIISGGYSEEDFSTLNDTWAFDMRRGTWNWPYVKAPTEKALGRPALFAAPNFTEVWVELQNLHKRQKVSKEEPDWKWSEPSDWRHWGRWSRWKEDPRRMLRTRRDGAVLQLNHIGSGTIGGQKNRGGRPRWTRRTRSRRRPSAMTYRATVIGYDHDLLGPVWFQIRVVSSGPAAQVHFTWHRFNAFKHLAEYLRHRCPDLPSLQPRGHLWERAVKVVNYSVFLKERQQSLTAFLQAVLVADPTVEDVLLREFLHLPSDGAYPRTGRVG